MIPSSPPCQNFTPAPVAAAGAIPTCIHCGRLQPAHAQPQSTAQLYSNQEFPAARRASWPPSIENPDPQFIMQNQLQAQQRFFDMRRFRPSSPTHQLQRQFHTSRTSPKKPAEEINVIQVQNVPRRRVVAADAGAIAQSLEYLSLEERQPHILLASLSQKAGWRGSMGSDGMHEKIQTGSVEINYQHHPAPGHLGNFRMDGIGSYGEQGKNNDVLKIIQDFTNKDREKEKNLARLILEQSKKGIQIDNALLQRFQLEPYHLAIERFSRLCYLISVKEITRRMNQGVRDIRDGGPVEELPYALAYIRSLKLIAVGALPMDQVFGANAPYGLPTGSKLSEPHSIAAAKIKLHDLNLRYERHFGCSFGLKEKYHQELLGAYGGDSDTDGECYDSGVGDLRSERLQKIQSVIDSIGDSSSKSQVLRESLQGLFIAMVACLRKWPYHPKPMQDLRDLEKRLGLNQSSKQSAALLKFPSNEKNVFYENVNDQPGRIGNASPEGCNCLIDSLLQLTTMRGDLQIAARRAKCIQIRQKLIEFGLTEGEAFLIGDYHAPSILQLIGVDLNLYTVKTYWTYAGQLQPAEVCGTGASVLRVWNTGNHYEPIFSCLSALALPNGDEDASLVPSFSQLQGGLAIVTTSQNQNTHPATSAATSTLGGNLPIGTRPSLTHSSSESENGSESETEECVVCRLNYSCSIMDRCVNCGENFCNGASCASDYQLWCKPCDDDYLDD